MERKMLGCLDDIPIEQIQRCDTSLFFIPGLNFITDLQTGLCSLSLPIIKVCLALKQHGPTRNTMAITFYPQI